MDEGGAGRAEAADAKAHEDGVGMGAAPDPAKLAASSAAVVAVVSVAPVNRLSIAEVARRGPPRSEQTAGKRTGLGLAFF